MTDKLRSDSVVRRELILTALRSTQQYEISRAVQWHEITRVSEKGIRRFKSINKAQRFLSLDAAVHNWFKRVQIQARLGLLKRLMGGYRGVFIKEA